MEETNKFANKMNAQCQTQMFQPRVQELPCWYGKRKKFSRRGKNLKLDTSRKARYTTSQKRY